MRLGANGPKMWMAFSHKTRTDPPTGDQRNIKTGGLSPIHKPPLKLQIAINTQIAHHVTAPDGAGLPRISHHFPRLPDRGSSPAPSGETAIFSVPLRRVARRSLPLPALRARRVSGGTPHRASRRRCHRGLATTAGCRPRPSSHT